MKKIFCLALLACIYFPLIAQKDTMVIRTTARLGVFSPDSENEAGDKDPLLTTKKFAALDDVVDGTTKIFLKNHAKAQEIAEKAGKWLVGKEIYVALLPQHKYMINDCLGIKASVGEYIVKFAMPFIKVDQNGLLIRFEIDRLEDNKVTVRTRPCYKDGQCHFSPQLAIGGTMTDIRLDITLNPIMDLQKCKIVTIGMPHFKWRIGGANYKPLQNDLDQMVKNMMEDALTVATELIMPGRIAEAFNFVNIGGNNCDIITGGEGNNSEASSSHASSSSDAWVITSNAQLKGSTGRLNLTCNEQAIIRAHLFNSGEAKYFDSWYKCQTGNLIPGSYDISVNGVKITGVPIMKGSDTRLKLGLLQVNITGNAPWEVLNMSGQRVYNNYGSKKIVLPVGQYKLKMQSREMPITIKDGDATEF